MKKILLSLLTILFLLAGCSQQKEEEELFIEFNYNATDGDIDYINFDYDKEIDPLGSDVILATNGIVTYTGKIDRRLLGQQRLTYTVTSETDPTNSKAYTVIFAAREPTTYFNSSGYPNSAITYEIDWNSWNNLETRWKFSERSGNVEIYITAAYFPDGNDGKGKGQIQIFQPGTDEVPWDNSKWIGDYEIIGENMYHVTDLHKEVYCGEMCTPEVGDTSYEAYFYLSSLDENGKLYYYMEYPENGYGVSEYYFECLLD